MSAPDPRIAESGTAIVSNAGRWGSWFRSTVTVTGWACGLALLGVPPVWALAAAAGANAVIGLGSGAFLLGYAALVAALGSVAKEGR